MTDQSGIRGLWSPVLGFPAGLWSLGSLFIITRYYGLVVWVMVRVFPGKKSLPDYSGNLVIN